MAVRNNHTFAARKATGKKQSQRPEGLNYFARSRDESFKLANGFILESRVGAELEGAEYIHTQHFEIMFANLDKVPDRSAAVASLIAIPLKVVNKTEAEKASQSDQASERIARQLNEEVRSAFRNDSAKDSERKGSGPLNPGFPKFQFC
jgi:hypothetical protein